MKLESASLVMESNWDSKAVMVDVSVVFKKNINTINSQFLERRGSSGPSFISTAL